MNPTSRAPGGGDAFGVGRGEGAGPIGPETIGEPEGGVKTSCAPENTIPGIVSNTIDVGASGTDVAPFMGYTNTSASGRAVDAQAMTDFAHDVPAASASPTIMIKMNRLIGPLPPGVAVGFSLPGLRESGEHRPGA